MINDPLHRRPARRTLAALLASGALAAAAGLSACSSSKPQAMPSGPTWSVGTPTGPAGSVAGSPTGAASTTGVEPGSGPPSPGAATSGPPAQAPADAARDKVPSPVAALPSTDRVRQVAPEGDRRTRVVTSGDGVWMISQPRGAAPGYGEVLHLDGAGRIMRAYPFAGVAPQWLLVTAQAVYCGRGGDAAAPDAMVCRIDRRTGGLRVLVTADRTQHTAITDADLPGRPGDWLVDDVDYRADLGVPPRVGTELTFSSGGELRLSPDTLAVLGS